MNTEQERTLHHWLAARDPGDAPARLRAVAREIPMTTRPRAFAGLDVALRHGLRLSTALRPLVVLIVLLVVAVAIAGALVLRPWDPFPPRGLIAYVGPLGSTGASGIRLVLPDGTGGRAVSPGTANVFDHSPRWSADGRTLAFGRTSDLSAFASCEGVGSIVLYDVATATERVVATGLRPMGDIEWTPAGDRIAFLWPPPGCGAPGELGSVDVASGSLTETHLGDGSWRLQRSGGAIEAVDTTVWEVDSLTGELVVRCTPRGGDAAAHVQVQDRASGEQIDLGIGWAPAWSPDESAIAFVQVTDEPAGGPADGARVAVASVQGWQVRTLTGIIDPDFAQFGDVARLPLVQWTRDGTAIYWLDAAGAHIVDVASGRALDLTRILIGASDLRWQPTPVAS
jgi:dipeptidyl aminopeptidase/acylaminoacyl peptidase